MANMTLNLTLNNNGSITAKWSSVSGAVRYHAYMYIHGADTACYNEKNLTTTSYTSSSNLTAGKKYSVTVYAYSSSKQLSAASANIFIPSDFYRASSLGIPQNVSATAAVTSVTVKWSAVSGATGYDVLFNGSIYSVTGTSKAISGLKAKTSYSYAVRAKNASKTGAYSTTKTITTLAQSPAVPTNIKKTVTETSATISWGKVSGATSYTIVFNGSTYNLTGTSKTFTGLKVGTAYTFKICAKNADATGAYTNNITVTTAPKAPTTVSATSTANSVTVKWSAVSGATGYIIRFNGTDYHAIGTSNTFTGLTPNKSYTYQVCAKSADGSGSYSTAKSIVTLAQTPVVPINIRKNSTDNSVTLSWSAVSGATGYDVLFNGNVYSVSSNTKTITGLLPNTKYTYQVRSKNASGTSAYSTAQTVTTTSKPPTSINASVEEDNVVISWNAMAGATGYDILFNGTLYSTAAATSKMITGLTPNTSYTYQIRVKNADGISAYSTARTVRTAPNPPASSSVTAQKNSVTLSWPAVSGATSYDVLFNGTVRRVTGTTITISGLQPGTGYTYSIRSNNAGGSSTYSASKTANTLPNPPSLPTNVSVSVSQNTATVKWNAVSGATSYDVRVNATNYRVTGTSKVITGLTAGTNYSFSVRANNAGGSSTYTAAKVVQTLPNPPAVPKNISSSVTNDSIRISWGAVSGADSYDVAFNGNVYRVTGTAKTISGLSPNASYTYQVRANNAGGSSAYSTAQSVRTLPNPPGVPSNVNATATTDSVTVNWSSVSGATSYDVRVGSIVHNVATTTATIDGLTPGTDYTYQVRAKNAGGSSAYSAEKTIRTLQVPPHVPTGVLAVAKAHSVEVMWDNVDGADSYDVLFDNIVSNVVGTSKLVDQLSANTEYSYQVRAKNSAGTSDYCVIHTVRTLLDTPINIQAEATPETVTVQWNKVEGATSYVLKFNGTEHNVTDTFAEITGLKPETEYSYSVCAKNEYVESEYSKKENVTTLRPGPDTPSDIIALSTMNSIIISWSPVSDANDYDIEFDNKPYNVTESGVVAVVEEEGLVEVEAPVAVSTFAAVRAVNSNNEITPVAAANSVDTATPRIFRVFTGLKPNTNHSYIVRANNESGSSHYSPLKFIKTDIRKRNGLPNSKSNCTYPDGRIPYMGLDPVNALTGAFLWSYTWLQDYGKDTLHFTTMYDSQRDEYHKALGSKWTYSLNYLLYMDDEYAYFSTPYDEVVPFSLSADGDNYPSAEGVQSDYSMSRMEDGSYCIRNLDGAEYIFDSQLCLKQMVENGLVTYRFTADDKGQISRIESRHGRSLSLSYMDGHISCVTDAMGNKVTFTYEDDRLALVLNPDGKGMSFTYDDAGNLLKITDFAGTDYVTNEYDVQGRVTAQSTAGRGNSTVSYDEANRVTIFTDEAGHETKYSYDEDLRVTCVESADQRTKNRYNDKGQLIEQTDALGNSVKMAYDDCGRMNHVIHADETEEKVFYNDRNYPVRVVNRDGTECSYEYDERNNLVSVCDERGNECFYSYDDADNLVSYTDKNGNIWTYAYDENNHLKQAEDPEGNVYGYAHDAIGRLLSHTLPTGKKTSYEYSASGELLKVTDADGAVTYEYNGNGNQTGITDKRGSKQRFAYNAMGQMEMATDFMGNEYHFSYDEKGNLVAETDPAGHSAGYAYDAVGNRTRWTDKNGGTTDYTFDAAGQLIAVTDPAGGMVRYYRDTAGRVKTVIDPLDHPTAYTYDAAGRVTGVTDALGHSVSYTYDPAGNLLTRTDEDGAVVEHTYDKENRLTDIKSDAGTVHFTYDKLGRVIAVQDEAGHAETAAYDGDGNLCEFSDKEENRTLYQYDDAGRLCEETAPNGSKTTYAYDKNGNCTKITDAEGNERSYAYDANNRVIKETDPAGYETAYEYDTVGNLVSVTDAKGGKAVFEYDGNGNLVKETNPLGGVMTYTYDRLNRLVEAADEDGHKYTYTYDAAGNRIAYTDANENRWEYEYDAVNRLKGVTGQDGGHMEFAYTPTGQIAQVTDPEGAKTSYRYDAMGRLVEISDALENSLSWTYDSQGRVLTQTDACGNTTEYGYSPSGNLLSVKDPEGNETTYTYNALGQVVTQTDALGNERSYTYDALGRVTSMTDALGNKTSFTYTVRGEIATVTNAEGGVTEYTYDACGNLVQSKDALGNIVEYEYDAMNNRIRECLSASGEQSCATLYQYDKKGRLVRELNPMSEEKAYTYDGNGNIVTIVDEDGHKTAVEYDLNNRPISMCYSDGREAAFRYNSRGELVEMKDWNGITTLEYNPTGKLTKVTDHNGQVTGYDYDAAGRRTAITYPDGSRAGYTYDKNHRLSTVTDALGQMTQYQYDAVGHVLSVQQPGSKATCSYNAGGLPAQMKYSFDDGTFMEETLTYDAMGRILGREQTGSSSELAHSASYAYDALGQLLTCKEGTVTEAYGYDALGNRLFKDVDGIRKATYQYNGLNQLVGRTENGISYGYGYDKRGNLTEERCGDSLIRQYTYDVTNHLVLGKNLENGEKTEYGYNGLYMRVKNVQTLRPDGWYGQAGQAGTNQNAFLTRETSYVTDYLSGANNELMVFEKGLGMTRTVYGRGYERLGQSIVPEADTATDAAINTRAVLARTTTGNAYFQSDHLGSPLFAANTQGEVLRYAQRSAWGDMKLPVHGDLNAAGLEDNFRYTNYQYDPVIGTYFAQARFYDAVSGRMSAKDPVKNGLNAYPYCGNDPMNRVDPTGEIPTILAGAGAGLIAGGIYGFGGSVISQLANGGKVDWKQAIGAAANGAITGAARGAIAGSGAGVVATLATDFIAGTVGSAVEQKISRGTVGLRESLTGGLTNAVSGLIYGKDPLKSFKSAVGRGAGAGAATAAINYISDAIGSRTSQERGAAGSAIAGAFTAVPQITPYAKYRDPKTICGVPTSVGGGIEYGISCGYQYNRQRSQRYGGGGNSRPKKKEYSLSGFMKEVLIGGITGGVFGAGFYGAKVVGSWMNGIRGNEGGTVPVVKIQKNVEIPLLPEGSQWERNVLNSFAGGKSNPVTYGGGTTLYRVGGKNGGFWSLDPPPVTEYQWRVDFAIKQEFCNDASTLYKMTIPKGSSLSGLEGTVGTQGMGLYGGAHQVYIDYRAVPSDWIEISPTNWK